MSEMSNTMSECDKLVATHTLHICINIKIIHSKYKMMKKQILFLLFLSAALTLPAQTLETSNVGSAGKYLTSTAGSLQYNIGEVIILQSDEIRAGVIQFVDISTLVIDEDVLDGIVLYPNPSSGPAYLSQEQDLIENWMVINGQGRCVSQFKATSSTTAMDLSNLPAGMYYIVPSQDGKFSKALPLTIIK